MSFETAYSIDNAESAQSFSSIPFEMKPLGFVVKSDGEFAAIHAQDDEVCIVWQGDRFAGHLRAIRVSADAVEAVEDTPQHTRPLPFVSAMQMPELLSASQQQVPSLVSTESCVGCDSTVASEVAENRQGNPLTDRESAARGRGDTGILPGSEHGQDGHATRTEAPAISPATLIFQTLGYVESQDGEVQAIVADGAETYLVKQGEIFADQYEATSVDPLLVLAVRVSPVKHVPDFLSAQTDFGGKPASKRLDGSMHETLSGGTDLLSAASLRQGGHATGTDLGVNLFNTLSTGLDMHSHLYTTDNPKLGY
jgi:hypothetical protein